MRYLDSSQCQDRIPASEQQVAALARSACDGDRAAFERLVGLFHEDIFRLVYYRTRSRMDAEDLTQDIFLSAFKNIGGLKDLDKFRPWLYRIAVNRVRDFHRKKRFLDFFGLSTEEEPERADIDADGDPPALDQLIRHEFWERVKSLANKFSPMEREVFTLRFMDQLGLREIAEVLDKSESAIKTHLYRALKKFKDDSAFRELLEGGLP